jgi:Golgi apyrase
LLDHAYEQIPDDRIEDTPIFLLATAGVRLLPDLERKALLQEVCDYTRRKTDFVLPDCALHIQVIPGETEGLYGWIAANYLLGGFDAPSHHDHGKGHHTYGFLDMGGASAQIAFAPNATEADKHAEDLKLLRLRNVNGAIDEYRVFVTTWLGFGVHEAHKRYVQGLLDENDTEEELPDPCLPKGLKSTTDIPPPNKLKGRKVHLLGTGKFKECLRRTFPLLRKDVPCEDAPCLLNGQHVPAIDFDVNHFVGVSEYWHTTHDVFEMGHKDKAYDFATYQKRVAEFCSQDWDNIQKGIKEHKWGKKLDDDAALEICFKANWIMNVLHDGIGIPRLPIDEHKHSQVNGTKKVLQSAKDRGFTDSFQAVNKIEDTEVSWTLGKMVLYAASEIPPGKGSALPVGFGSNVAGIPADFQYPGSLIHANTTHNATAPQEESWRDTLFEGKTPRRIPGFLLFLVIACVAIFLLCGKDRRSRIYHKLFSRCSGPGGKFGRRKGGGMFTPKISLHGQNERLLENGIRDPNDFELGEMGSDEDTYSDDSGSKTGKTSGWMTPRLRTPHLDSSNDDYISHGGGSSTPNVGLGLNAMDRSGLFVRNESRESLHSMQERGRKSRRGSPTRHKSPLLRSLPED